MVLMEAIIETQGISFNLNVKLFSGFHGRILQFVTSGKNSRVSNCKFANFEELFYCAINSQQNNVFRNKHFTDRTM